MRFPKNAAHYFVENGAIFSLTDEDHFFSLILNVKTALFSLVPFLLTPIVPLMGQTQNLPPQIEQSRQTLPIDSPLTPMETEANLGTSPTFTAESPGDDDLGQQVILKKKQVYEPFSINLGTDLTYTSNVGLSETFEQEDWFWRSVLNATYAPRFGNYLLGIFSVTQELFRYDEFDALDFESLTLSAGVAYNLWFLGGINASLQFDYNRLTSDDFGDEIFSNRTINLTFSRNFILSRAHYFYVASSLELGWSDPEAAARNEFTLLGGYHVRLARNFELDLIYRAGYYHYTEIDREDFNQTIQLSARYHFTKWLTANANISGIFNASDRNGFDYEALNTGAGIFVSWKF